MEYEYLVELEDLVRYRWDVRVLVCLADGPQRFVDIARRVRQTNPEASDSVLTRALRQLTDAGLIDCQQDDDNTRLWAPTEAGARRARRVLFLLSTLACMNDDGNDRTTTKAPAHPDGGW